jgi:pilus assembly protein CpaF
VVQVQRSEDGRRRVVSLQEVNGMEGEIITMSEIFHFQRTGLDEQGNVLGSLQPTGVVPSFHQRLAIRGIHLPVSIYRAS